MIPKRYKTLEDFSKAVGKDMDKWKVSIEEDVSVFLMERFFEFSDGVYEEVKFNGVVIGYIRTDCGLKIGDVINIKVATIGYRQDDKVYLKLDIYEKLSNLVEKSIARK